MKRLVLLLLLCLAPPAFANDWDALAQPGAHAIMRHALAPGTGDPAHFDVNDCATQRNLDARGRAQAEQIGSALRARGARFERLLSSAWCRSFETAELLDLGAPERLPALNSFFQDRSSAAAQTEALREVIRAADGPLMMVTHQVNITALTGEFVRSGEIFVIREGDDGIEVLGSILISR